VTLVKKDGTTYNTYRIKRFNDDKTQILISSSDQSNDTIRTQLANNAGAQDIDKFLKHDADKAVVQIYLEKDDKDGLLDNNNNNTNFLESMKPTKGNCSTRKKRVKKKVDELIKNATHKVGMKILGFI